MHRLIWAVIDEFQRTGGLWLTAPIVIIIGLGITWYIWSVVVALAHLIVSERKAVKRGRSTKQAGW